LAGATEERLGAILSSCDEHLVGCGAGRLAIMMQHFYCFNQNVLRLTRLPWTLPLVPLLNHMSNEVEQQEQEETSDMLGKVTSLGQVFLELTTKEYHEWVLRALLEFFVATYEHCHIP
jgi:hypothetical protein